MIYVFQNTAHVMNHLLVFILAVLAEATAKIEFPAEWHAWKSEHKVAYSSELEELRKHVVWRSNKELIDQHNKYADVFGYTLGMNKFGDLVSFSGKI